MIYFKCPECSELLIVPSCLAGRTENCPGCRSEIPVPAPGLGLTDEEGDILICNNCGELQHDGEREELTDARARRMGSSGSVNLGPLPQCLVCGSTDLINASEEGGGGQPVSPQVDDLPQELAAAGRKWLEPFASDGEAATCKPEHLRANQEVVRLLREKLENVKNAIAYLDSCEDFTFEHMVKADEIAEGGMSHSQLQHLWNRAIAHCDGSEHVCREVKAALIGVREELTDLADDMGISSQELSRTGRTGIRRVFWLTSAVSS